MATGPLLHPCKLRARQLAKVFISDGVPSSGEDPPLTGRVKFSEFSESWDFFRRAVYASLAGHSGNLEVLFHKLT